jgi:formate-dependent phosphoribosylglycinamide formyltransferase (GAR transformylase)
MNRKTIRDLAAKKLGLKTAIATPHEELQKQLKQ